MTGNFEIAVALFIGLLVLIALRMPIGLAMILCGGLGFGILAGVHPLMGLLAELPYSRVANHELTVIPLFVLMGQFAAEGGISKALYRAARAWVGHFRGGLAIATIGGCAAFGSICGSSIATGATMATVALPEMRRFGYSGALSTATLAAGGTLGILIPPSIILVIYAILTEQSLAALFLAAVIPGVLAAIGYMIAVGAYVRIYPDAGPAGPRANWRERIASLGTIWPVVVIFLTVIGGIYLGVFTPTEGAAVGAASTGLLAVLVGDMRWPGLKAALRETGRITGMIFIILIGAELYSSFLALSQIPQSLAEWISGLGWHPMTIMIGIVLLYLVLGCVMDTLAMILLTVPVLLPIVSGLELGIPPSLVLIWFGILVLSVAEVGLITPPIGLNVFVINTLAKDVPLMDSFKGVVPFLVSDAVRISIILFIPATTYWLVGTS